MAPYSDGWNIVYIILLCLSVLSFLVATFSDRLGRRSDSVSDARIGTVWINLVALGLFFFVLVPLIDQIRLASAS